MVTWVADYIYCYLIYSAASTLTSCSPITSYVSKYTLDQAQAFRSDTYTVMSRCALFRTRPHNKVAERLAKSLRSSFLILFSYRRCELLRCHYYLPGVFFRAASAICRIYMTFHTLLHTNQTDVYIATSPLGRCTDF